MMDDQFGEGLQMKDSLPMESSSQNLFKRQSVSHKIDLQYNLGHVDFNDEWVLFEFDYGYTVPEQEIVEVNNFIDNLNKIQITSNYKKLFCQIFRINLQVKKINSEYLFCGKLPILKIGERVFFQKEHFIMILEQIYYKNNIQENLGNQNIVNLCHELYDSVVIIYYFIQHLVQQFNQQYYMWFVSEINFSYRDIHSFFLEPKKKIDHYVELFYLKKKLQQRGILNKEQAILNAQNSLNILEHTRNKIESFDVLAQLKQNISLNDIIVYSYLKTIFENIPTSEIFHKMENYEELNKFYSGFSQYIFQCQQQGFANNQKIELPILGHFNKKLSVNIPVNELDKQKKKQLIKKYLHIIGIAIFTSYYFFGKKKK